MRLLRNQLHWSFPVLFLPHSAALHLSCALFHLLSPSLSDDCLHMSVFLFLGCFAVFIVVATAGSFSSWVVHHCIELSLAAGHEHESTFVEQPIGTHSL